MKGLRIALNHTYLRMEGGVERYVYSLTERLVRSGCRVDFYGIRKDPKILHMNLRFIKVPVVKGAEFLKVLSFALNSASLIRRNGPYDVVMGFSKTFYHNVYRDGSGCREDYVKVMGIRAGPFSFFYESVVRFVERMRYSFPSLSHILTVSKMVKEQIERRYPGCRAAILPVYSGVEVSDFLGIGKDEARMELQRLFSINSASRVLLFVGNDFGRKGLMQLLEALSYVDPGLWVLFVLGKDERMGRYVELSKKMGFESRVFFLGFRHDRAIFFRGSDIFVLPSRFDAIANVILEALVSGTFVVSTPSAGGTELIREGIDGFRIKSFEELKLRLHSLITGKIPPRRPAFHLDLSWEAHMRVLESVFQKVSPL